MNAHHNIDALIDMSGGPNTFISRWKLCSLVVFYPAGNSFDNTILNPGNVPSFTAPYFFNFIGRQDLSVKYSRFITQSFYQPTITSLPGTSNAGAMPSHPLWNILELEKELN